MALADDLIADLFLLTTCALTSVAVCTTAHVGAAPEDCCTSRLQRRTCLASLSHGCLHATWLPPCHMAAALSHGWPPSFKRTCCALAGVTPREDCTMLSHSMSIACGFWDPARSCLPAHALVAAPCAATRWAEPRARLANQRYSAWRLHMHQVLRAYLLLH